MIVEGSIRLSVAVMTHPARIAPAHQLARSLCEPATAVVVDPDPGTPLSCLRNARRAWSRVAPTATHHLVIQDDVRLCDNFVRHLSTAVRQRPEHAISLFTEWGSDTSSAVRLAALAGSRWAPIIDPYMPTVGLVLPASAARLIAADTDEAAPADDVAVHRILLAAGVPLTATVPGLLQHVGDDSLVGNGHMGARRAALFDRDPPPAGLYAAGSSQLFLEVPFYDTRSCRPMAAIGAGREGPPWMIEPFQTYMQRHGIQPARLLRAGPAGERAEAWLRCAGLDMPSQRILGGLRCVAHALGRRAAQYGDGTALVDRRALATAVAGALRWTLTPAAIDNLAEPAETFLNDAADRGYEDGLALHQWQEQPSTSSS